MSRTHFITSHPGLVVVSASRASKLCLASTRDELGGLISISDEYPMKRPPAGVFHALPGLRLTFDDVERENVMAPGAATACTPPTLEDVARALRFAANFYRPKSGKRLLVHCFAGRSRSTAIAFAILCQHLGPGRADEAMVELCRACEKSPLPNMLIARYADQILGFGGELRERAASQNNYPLDAECESGPVTGTALLAAVKRGEL